MQGVVITLTGSVVSESSDVFELCTEVSCEGKMSDDVKSKLEEEIGEIKEAVSDATKAFYDAKKALNITGISIDMNDEHAFCLSVCAFGRLTMDFAQALVDDKAGTKECQKECKGYKFFEDRRVLVIE